jgi:hypothetical protein
MARPKKSQTKAHTDAEKYLAKVPEKYVFWCSDGRIIHDMNELAEALSNISEETFAYHCNAQKNDFSRWVADIVTDETLARDMDQTRDKGQTASVVKDRVSYLKSG